MRRQNNTAQLTLLDDLSPQDESNAPDTSTTFIGNLSLPVHRWFRYTAGFSAEWVRDVVTAERAAGRNTVLDPLADSSVEFVITSPPYANNYDYADATRLELSFFGYVQGWGDLQEYVRRHLVRSCSQHVGGIVRTTDALVEDAAVAPIADELRTVVAELLVERENHGGKKNYHTMIAAYFNDLARVWTSLRRVTAPGGRVCFVVGDSAPYGVHVPVDRWLGDLAVSAGFESYHFEKTRDRNIKWKNRKHRVPLHEGKLWVEG